MRSRGVTSATILAAGALLAGCSSGPPTNTVADLARANTLVASAQSGGAQQYAPAELQAARDKAQQANQLQKDHPQRADRLANEAAVDAQLANARAQNAKAQHALDDLHRSLQTLRSETEREQDTAAPSSGEAPGPTGAPPENEAPQSPNQGTAPQDQSPPQGGAATGSAGPQ